MRMAPSVVMAIVLYVSIAQAQSQCQPNCTPGYKCVLNNCVLDIKCPQGTPWGKGPPSTCASPTDPLNKPQSKMESWFSQEIFNDLFPKANIGWGPTKCWPYSYEAFVIAARYFPDFATESPQNGFRPEENYRRDLAGFFSHAIQETGENDIGLYTGPFKDDWEKADACFYRGGFYNWFEGGPKSMFLPPETPGFDPKDGEKCIKNALYCDPSNKDYPCYQGTNGSYYLGCYFGRGAIQLSYNFNYGPFQNWLKSQGIDVNLLQQPNLLMTKMDPPLSIMASLWFYMTPQPPKPAMHDLVLGNWKASDQDAKSGYQGPAFGPTSLVINNECNGEDGNPGGGGENRRIKAFKWFSKYFGYRLEDSKLLSCKNLQGKFDTMRQNVSFAVDWSSLDKDGTCNCAPAEYFVTYPYYQPGLYPSKFSDLNENYRQLCVKGLYENPRGNQLSGTEKCMQYPPSGVQRPTQPPTTPKAPGGSAGPLDCPGAGVLIPDPESCASYFQCDANNNPRKLTCPQGLLFSAEQGVCNWPSMVKCNAGKAPPAVSPDKPTTPAPPSPPGTFQCPGSGVFPDPESCNSFYTCDAAGAPGHKSSCAPKLLFDANAGACNWASMVKCNGKPVINQQPITTKQPGCA